MKKLSFLKERKNVCMLKFRAYFDGIPITDYVKVDFKELVLVSEYSSDVFTLKGADKCLSSDIEVDEKGFIVSLYFEEPEDESLMETKSVNYQLGEGFVVDIKRTNIDVTFKRESLADVTFNEESLPIEWIPTMDDILELDIPLMVEDDVYVILESLKDICENKELLTYVYKDVLNKTSKSTIKRLATISSL